jgi:hypothetical protein
LWGRERKSPFAFPGKAVFFIARVIRELAVVTPWGMGSPYLPVITGKAAVNKSIGPKTITAQQEE